LVGGAVRDWLRGSAVSDYDLEVFGLSPEALHSVLKRLGPVHQVGKSFGVSLLQCDGMDLEIALPRRENKTAPGHKGFDIACDPHLSFAEASSRRDFTVNAMGMSLPDGKLIDEHGGRNDLQKRTLRHVSSAFSEDPLRALRAAQFAARFEFSIHPSTLALCRVQPLEELPAERLFGEFKKLLLASRRPSLGLEALRRMGQLRHFPELMALIGVPQESEWHPEGDVWTHTLMVVDEAAALRTSDYSETENLALMLAALCHDLGKPATTVYKEGRWRSPGHDTDGEAPTRSFLARITRDLELIELIVALVREHLRPALLHKVRDTLRPSAIRRLSLRVSIEKLVRLARADHWGRTTDEALNREFEAGDWLMTESQTLQVLVDRPKAFLTGKFLLASGMRPGPKVGELIRESFELQLEGELADLAAAEGWALEQLRKALEARI
jgi:tRNA nucleotidyltransferase (CCA-adding enzyme)